MACSFLSFIQLNALLRHGVAGPSSAFEKWSVHVEPKGCRMGVFRDLTEEKVQFIVSRSDFISS